MDDTDRWPYREDRDDDQDWNPWRQPTGSWSDNYLHMTEYARQYSVDLYRRNDVRPKKKAKKKDKHAKKKATHWWSLQ